MKLQILSLIAALVAGLTGSVVTAPGAALAQTAAPAASSEAERALATQAARLTIKAIDMRAVMRRGMEQVGSSVRVFKSRPEWRELMQEAFLEEVAARPEVLENAFGKLLSRNFTAGELREGVALLSSPGVSGYIGEAAKAGGIPLGLPPRQVQAAMQRAMSTPEGRGLMQKLMGIEALMTDEFMEEAIVGLAPGAMRRFGEKAEAAERARASRGQ